MTVERATRIRNRMGLHARPSAELVKVAGVFVANISLGKDGMWVNGKSIMGVMTLAAEYGSEVKVRAEGEDAEAAAAAIVACLEKEFVEQ